MLIGCPANSVQLITSNEVIDSSVLHGDNFSEVVDTTHIFNRYFWEIRGQFIPNQGNLTFNDTYVLLGITTAGDVQFPDRQFYVSNFSLHYSESLNSSFMFYPKVT